MNKKPSSAGIGFFALMVMFNAIIAVLFAYFGDVDLGIFHALLAILFHISLCWETS